MARPIKKGIDYFSFDTDFFEDTKIKKLRVRYGACGLAIYIYIISRVYKENGYYVIYDEDLNIELIDLFKLTQPEVENIICYLINLNLFETLKINKDIMVLTSERIQKTYQISIKSRGKKTAIKVNKNIWLLPQEITAEYIKIE